MEALLLHSHASGAARVAPAPATATATVAATVAVAAAAAATHVQLTVRCGRHLPNMQVIGCNVYCHVQWQGQTHITDVKINSFSPEWGQTFKFALDSQGR